MRRSLGALATSRKKAQCAPIAAPTTSNNEPAAQHRQSVAGSSRRLELQIFYDDYVEKFKARARRRRLA